MLIVTALLWVPFAAAQESSAIADTAAATGTDDHADERADATVLTTSAEGRIDPAGEVDYFRIEVPERLAVTVHATGDLDMVGRLECFHLPGGVAEEVLRYLLYERGIGVISFDNKHLRVAFAGVDTADLPELYEEIYAAAEACVPPAAAQASAAALW